MKTGIANLPLHGGKCPAWLFRHMQALCAAIIEVILEDFGPIEVLRRLSNPYWFQALGCVAGFDWHSSGLTTTVCGAIKEGMKNLSQEAGIFFAGGKGKMAVNTPNEIIALAEKNPLAINANELIYASKMSAKIDSAAVQDNYKIYHHFFVFTKEGEWAVIQQGLNESNRQARRYHWLSFNVDSFVDEPQTAICCNHTEETLNLVSRDNKPFREISSIVVNASPEKILKEISLINKHYPELNLPGRHTIPNTTRLNKSLYAAYQFQPHNFEQLLQVKGVGASTLRALAMVAEIAWGTGLSFSDPVRYSFAHGGKDGFPFPVNEKDIENSYVTLQRALKKSKAGHKDQIEALRRLSSWFTNCSRGIPRQRHQISNERAQTALGQANKTQPLCAEKPRPQVTQPCLF